jgi:glycogen debranching enzyme
VIAKVTGSGERISTYEIADDQMAAGSTFGSPKMTLTIKATGAIEKVYSIEAGLQMLGTVVLHHWDEVTGIPLPALPGQFVIHPDHQEHIFELANGVTVRENIFALSGEPDGNRCDPPAAYYTVELQNDTDQELRISTYASAQLRGNTGHDVVTAYDSKNRAILAWNQSDKQVVRAMTCSATPTSYETTLDSGKASAQTFPGKLAKKLLKKSVDPIGILHLSHRLRAKEHVRFAFTLSFSIAGRAGMTRTLNALPTAARALARTSKHYDKILDRAVLMTPDQDVNRGVLWAKANMLRVQSLAQTGWCFVNDPTRSNNSVGRDTAWFAFGADYITPDFARDSLRWYAEHLERSGLVVEYYDIRTGKTEDYGLNINDNTPLLILALWHHYNTTGDKAFLRELYPKALKAARHILSQRNEQGLVWCTATGTSDWGIVGWRNVIQNYRLSGATTELNSECYAALGTISHMAHALGKHAQALEFKEHAQTLREAINAYLFDSDSGLYYLNIDLDGNPRSDVTSDLIFPVMFNVADDEMAAHIISRMSVPEFWTDAGIHTVPRNDINYGPTHGYGLLGGVWVGVSFWYAFAAARFNPQFMAYSLGASFLHYSKDPRRNNTVPGQFSEWLHGETLTNQGMMLSPWFPPRYLWAAIEGAAGLDLSGGSPSVNPRLAPDWKWLGVRNLPLRGENVTWFVVRTPDQTMYANFEFDQSMPSTFYSEDISAKLGTGGDASITIGLKKGDRYAILVGNTTDHTITTALSFKSEMKGRYQVRSFNSLRGSWVEPGHLEGEELHRGVPIQLDRKGFCILELHEDL